VSRKLEEKASALAAFDVHMVDARGPLFWLHDLARGNRLRNRTALWARASSQNLVTTWAAEMGHER
jgi:hypothetical protein